MQGDSSLRRTIVKPFSDTSAATESNRSGCRHLIARVGRRARLRTARGIGSGQDRRMRQVAGSVRRR